MIRRSFRLGLWVGLLFGIAFALVKAVQSRRTSPEATLPSKDPWPPVARVEPVAERPAPGPVPATAPTREAPVDRPPRAADAPTVGEDVTPAPAPKKAAAKKAVK